jgi:HEAT repeat protein
LEHWLTRAVDPKDHAARGEARNVLRQEAPQVVPHLRRDFQKSDTVLDPFWESLRGWFPESLARQIPAPAYQVRARAANLLYESTPEDPDAGEWLIAAWYDNHREVRARSWLASIRLGPAAAPAVPEVIPLLKRPDGSVDPDIVRLLGEIGPEAQAAVPHLEDLLKQSTPFARVEIATALWKIDPSPEGILPALIDLLLQSGRDQVVFKKTTRLLGRMGTAAQRAVPALQACQSDTNRWMQRMSAEALAKIQSDATDPK